MVCNLLDPPEPVFTALLSPQDCVAVANPLAGADKGIAFWFHSHLTQTFVSVLRTFREFGASESIGVILFCLVLFFIFQRCCPAVVTLILAVPGGIVLDGGHKVSFHVRLP